MIITPAEHYFVEPARKYSKEANVTDYVIYKESDVLTSSSGDCGVTLSETVAQKAAEIRLSSQPVAEIEQKLGIKDDQLKRSSLPREQKIHRHHARITRSAATAFPGCATAVLPFNSTVPGNLQGNCVSDGRWFDIYTFSGSAGQDIVVSMSSAVFATYLYLLAPDGAFLAENDDGGGGTNARIPANSGTFTLPTAGTYKVYVTS